MGRWVGVAGWIGGWVVDGLLRVVGIVDMLLAMSWVDGYVC